MLHGHATEDWAGCLASLRFSSSLALRGYGLYGCALPLSFVEEAQYLPFSAPPLSVTDSAIRVCCQAALLELQAQQFGTRSPAGDSWMQLCCCQVTLLLQPLLHDDIFLPSRLTAPTR